MPFLAHTADHMERATPRRRLAIRLTFALALLLALVLALVLSAWLALRGSLPRLDGEGALTGLFAEVQVQRDTLGSVTIDAYNRDDAARALGFVHAQERGFEMDLLRRSAAGELAALFGSRALEHDQRQRLHRMRWRAQRQVQMLPPRDRDWLRAYGEGVNAGMDALRTRPWPYLLLRQRPQPWKAEDSLLVGHAMYFDLQDARNRRELALDSLRTHLPPALFALLTHDGSQWDAPLFGDAIGDAALPDATQVDLRSLPADTTAPLPPLPEPELPGSNNFAVSGALTADGRAILADDMHLALRAPNLWFRARLRYPDPTAAGGKVDATGFTLPGLPAVIVGSNGHVAWGFTNSYGDWLDWMRLPGCTGTRAIQERIDVAGDAAQTLTVRESDWGPVLHELADGDCLALRWVAHQPGSLNVALGELAGAGDMDAALAVAQRMALPTQNLLLADSAGRIAWVLAGPEPQRASTCTSSAIDTPAQCPPWHLSQATPPRLVDPADGRLWTANARTLDGMELARIGDGGYALGARARQIREALNARTALDESALLAIQLDDRAVLLTRWWELLQQHREGGSALRELAQAAAQWQGRAATDSVSYRLVRDWRQAVHARLLDGLLAPARASAGADIATPDLPQFEGVAWPLVSTQPTHLLPRRYPNWQALFEDAARAVIDSDDAPLATRAWGRTNIAEICHPLAAAIPAIGKRLLCMPREPLPGDGMMPRVQAPSFGASQRMVVAPGRETDAIAHMPGGQSGHPLSPFWGAGHDDWVHGRPTPLLPGPARHRLRLTPQGAAP